MEQQINLYQPIMVAAGRLFSAGTIAASILFFAVCLGAISGFAGWRVRSAERTIAAIELQEASRLAALERGLGALHAGASLESLDAQARKLAADIAEREQVLAAVRHGAVDVTSGFSAQLEALGRQQVDGLWLMRIMLSAGDKRLALAGATHDASLVSRYLSALATEPTLGGARFDRFQLHRPPSGGVVMASLFEVGEFPASLGDGAAAR